MGMGNSNGKEACGRCASTTLVDATEIEKDPFEGDRIEVEEDELRKAALPVIFFGRLKRRLDEFAARLVYK